MKQKVMFGVVAAGLLLMLITLEWWVSWGVNANAIAHQALTAASGTNGDAGAVAAVLPFGARAVVVAPAGSNLTPAGGEVVVTEDPRAASEASLVTSSDVVASASGNGWWVAVAVPRPSPAAAVLLGIGVAVGGCGLGLLVRPRPAVRRVEAENTGRHDAVVRAVAEIVPLVPEGVAWQLENALTAGGALPFSPDGQQVTTDHHVVGVEPTGDLVRVATVARTVRPGYADHGRVVVHPKVVAYVAEEVVS
ncbi:hypothetical protein ACIA8G_08560 [Lentzea sp. NPDC051213]|uniref:hypothetical protein n=1 Tax=Lentzea sp. NPDC051213 TaxID=3364126 RepID=UPI00378C20DA